MARESLQETRAREIVRTAAMIESALLDGDRELAERLEIRFYKLQAGYGEAVGMLEHDEKEKPPVCTGCGYPHDECRCDGDIDEKTEVELNGRDMYLLEIAVRRFLRELQDDKKRDQFRINEVSKLLEKVRSR